MPDSWWHFFVHVTGEDFGTSYGKWVWYNFWSGIAGSFIVAVFASGAIWWKAYSCHRAWWCFRHGAHPAAGGAYKLCWKHHPDIPNKPSWEEKLRHHEKWKVAA